MRRDAKVDSNQAEIVKGIRALGGVVQHCHQLKNAFDILVGYNNNLYIVEIKTSDKHKLTSGELKCKQMFNSVGVDYHVISSSEEFKQIINTYINYDMFL